MQCIAGVPRKHAFSSQGDGPERPTINLIYCRSLSQEAFLISDLRSPTSPPLPPKIHVIGIGDDGLEAMPTSVRQTIADAEVLLGTDRTLALLPKSPAARHTIS